MKSESSLLTVPLLNVERGSTLVVLEVTVDWKSSLVDPFVAFVNRWSLLAESV